MPYKSMFYERLQIVRWSEPQPAEVESVLAEVRDAYARLGPPLWGMTVVPGATPPPNAEMRKLFSARLPELFACTESLHFVLEGTGFKNSILRSATTNIIMLTGKRGKISVYKSIDEALDALAPRLREYKISATSVRLAALNKGLLLPDREQPCAASP